MATFKAHTRPAQFKPKGAKTFFKRPAASFPSLKPAVSRKKELPIQEQVVEMKQKPAEPAKDTTTELDEINRMISHATKRLSQLDPSDAIAMDGKPEEVVE